ncbi:LuxR C-terminal-related transcriptional regulator [Streptomyces sp. R39]|uniref:LuxR C-terminal-related transcriptional regulator n=1 Tax=Streptomyces sp. R39 TaxID=3238631 RepID=A0AB39R6E8_9ACTN
MSVVQKAVSSADPVGPLADVIRSVRKLSEEEELFDALPGLVVRLGYDRAIASGVVDGAWAPSAVHVANDVRWARDIREAGRSAPQRLGSGLVEDRMVRTECPVVVRHVQGNPQVNRSIAVVSRSRSYLAAPILVGDHAKGFLHVDRYWRDGAFDRTDAAGLQAVAEAAGLALELMLLRKSLLGGLVDEHGRSAVVTPPRPGCGRPAPSPLALLTPRESEVTAMIADGLTNTQIAAELFVAEATVKSHVKGILRKLGARHRAEVVSMYLRSTCC